MYVVLLPFSSIVTLLWGKKRKSRSKRKRMDGQKEKSTLHPFANINAVFGSLEGYEGNWGTGRGERRKNHVTVRGVRKGPWDKHIRSSGRG